MLITIDIREPLPASKNTVENFRSKERNYATEQRGMKIASEAKWLNNLSFTSKLAGSILRRVFSM